MACDEAMKTILRTFLHAGRSDLMWKPEWPGERGLRQPRTSTGLKLTGVVKHMGQLEIGCFGGTFGRPWPKRAEEVTDEQLDTQGRIPHWQGEKAIVTLQQIMVHVILDLTRHLGQVDVLRESIDGQVGLTPRNPNMPDGQAWDAYLTKLRTLADTV